MAWQDALFDLRNELADARAQRQIRAADEDARLDQTRDELTRLSNNLEIENLLSDMNNTLLNGQGKFETILSWESEDDGDDDSEEPFVDLNADDQEEDIVTVVLSWDEVGERELAVEVFLSEGGIALHVSGVEIRPEREALEQALVEAFREELEF